MCSCRCDAECERPIGEADVGGDCVGVRWMVALDARGEEDRVSGERGGGVGVY